MAKKNREQIEKKASKAVEVYKMDNDILTIRYKDFSSKADKLVLTGKNIIIESDESVQIAENYCRDVKIFVDNLEKDRKELKEPYAKIVKIIDSYVKLIAERVELTTQKVKKDILQFKSIATAQVKVEIEKESKELSNDYENELGILKRLNNILCIMLAKIWGGDYITKDGIRKSSVGIINETEISSVVAFFIKSFPDLKVFEPYPQEANFMYSNMLSTLHQIEKRFGKQDFAFQALRDQFFDENMAILDRIEETINKKFGKEIRNQEIAIKQASKGIVQKLTFRIDESENKVPYIYLSVDENKIKSYQSEHLEDIKEKVKKGEQPIPGIVFYFEDHLRIG